MGSPWGLAENWVPFSCAPFSLYHPPILPHVPGGKGPWTREFTSRIKKRCPELLALKREENRMCPILRKGEGS